jgi:hypothetical protein
MANFTSNFENLTTHSGLYRIWVPLRDDSESPLVSIWVDPNFRAFEPCVEEKNSSFQRSCKCRPIHRAGSVTMVNAEDADSVFPDGM